MEKPKGFEQNIAIERAMQTVDIEDAMRTLRDVQEKDPTRKYKLEIYPDRTIKLKGDPVQN